MEAEAHIKPSINAVTPEASKQQRRIYGKWRAAGELRNHKEANRTKDRSVWTEWQVELAENQNITARSTAIYLSFFLFVRSFLSVSLLKVGIRFTQHLAVHHVWLRRGMWRNVMMAMMITNGEDNGWWLWRWKKKERYHVLDCFATDDDLFRSISHRY